MPTKLEKITLARSVLDAAIDTFQSIIETAVDDASPPEVTIGAYDGQTFPVTLTGEAPFSLEIQDKIGGNAAGWAPIAVNWDGTASIVTTLHSFAEGFNWRATAAAGGDHISACATGEVLPEAFNLPE